MDVVKPRPTGFMEQFNIVRERLRYYNNVGKTATHVIPRSFVSSWDETGCRILMKIVIRQVLQENVILNVVIDDVEASKPQWKYLTTLSQYR